MTNIDSFERSNAGCYCRSGVDAFNEARHQGMELYVLHASINRFKKKTRMLHAHTTVMVLMLVLLYLSLIHI